MPKISKDNDVQTVITTFEVSPATCQDLLDELTVVWHEFVRQQPGFVGVAMHVNDAKTRIANYSQWKTRDDFQALLRSDAMQEYNQKINGLCKSFEPVLYEVAVSID